VKSDGRERGSVVEKRRLRVGERFRRGDSWGRRSQEKREETLPKRRDRILKSREREFWLFLEEIEIEWERYY